MVYKIPLHMKGPTYPYKQANKLKKRHFKKSVKSLSKRITRIEHQEEKKLINVSFGALTSTLTSANPYIACINGNTKGLGDNGRIGDRVCNHRYTFRMAIYGPANIQSIIRLLIVRYKTPRGAGLAFADLFGAAAPSPMAVMNWQGVDIKSRYAILLDKTYVLQPKSTTQDGVVYIRRTMNLHKCVSDYSLGNAGTYADLDTSSYWMILLSDSTSNTAAYMSSNFFYTDD